MLLLKTTIGHFTSITSSSGALMTLQSTSSSSSHCSSFSLVSYEGGSWAAGEARVTPPDIHSCHNNAHQKCQPYWFPCLRCGVAKEKRTCHCGSRRLWWQMIILTRMHLFSTSEMTFMDKTYVLSISLSECNFHLQTSMTRWCRSP